MPQTGAPDIDRPASPASSTWARYRDNVARHLIGIARDLELRLMTHLGEQRGHKELRPSFGLLITLVAREPRPLAQLARALAISPQATSQLVALIERGGYLTRRSDPRDSRARWPVLTAAGERLVADAVAALRELEVEHGRRVGEEDYRAFCRALGILSTSPGGAKRAAVAAAGRERPSIGLLPILAGQLEQELMRATSLRGHAGLKLSHGQILTLVGSAGVRLHRLAQLHRVSRQAISATARDLESLGYLQREGDPLDGRGVVVRLTERGSRLIEDSVGALDDLELDWQQRLDPSTYARFTAVARRLYGALELEGAILSDAFPESFPAPGADADFEAAGGATLPAGTRNRTDTGHRVGTRASVDSSTDVSADELARLARRLRLRLGTRDAARLAAHLSAGADGDSPIPPPTPPNMPPP